MINISCGAIVFDIKVIVILLQNHENLKIKIIQHFGLILRLDILKQ